MKKLIYASLISMFVIIGFSTIVAQNKSGKGLRKSKITEKLNLTEAQKEKFDVIKFSFQESKIDLEANIKKNRLENKKMMSSDNINENSLMNNIDKGSVLMAEKRKSRVQMWLDIREILNDDQKKIWTKSFGHFSNDKDKFSGKGGKKAKRFSRNNCNGNCGENQKRFND